MQEGLMTSNIPRLTTRFFTILRLGLLLFSSLLIIYSTDNGIGSQYLKLVLLCFAILQLLYSLMYVQMMKNKVTRLLMCIVDTLVTCITIFITGIFASPFMPYLVFSLLTVHLLYCVKGLVIFIICNFGALATFLFVLNTNPTWQFQSKVSGLSVIFMFFFMLLLYISSYLGLKQYLHTDSKLKELKGKYNNLDDINSKLLVLYEITGKLNFDSSITQVMKKMLELCRDIFNCERSTILLVRNGEVELHGDHSIEEKAEIYNCYIEQKTGKSSNEGKYIRNEGAIMVPLVRGIKTDGVLALYGFNDREISSKDLILLTMVASIVSSYMENLEYLDRLVERSTHNDTSVFLSHLESGKPVTGILDKRILSEKTSLIDN